MTDARAMTVSSLTLPKVVRTSSWMPSAKNASSLSALIFSNGRTAMLFSETATAWAAGVLEADAAGWTRGFDFVKYHPAIAIRQAAATPAVMAIFLSGLLARPLNVGVCGRDNCNRFATSAVDRGRFPGSLARQAATVSSQIGGTNAGSRLNSLRRSVIDGA